MRGPQFMLGYWREPEATSVALRDGWFWSGDVVSRDSEDFYRVVDRRKEMIKYKGFPVAPAEVESVLLEHPAVRDCGVVGRADDIAGEIPVAFVVLRDSFASGTKLADELCGYVADRLTAYKQPREVRFVEGVPKTASGKILRRELRKILGEPRLPRPSPARCPVPPFLPGSASPRPPPGSPRNVLPRMFRNRQHHRGAP